MQGNIKCNNYFLCLLSIRFGDFVDISEGPHIPRTSFCCQYEVTAAHNLQSSQSELIRRFQGLSLPIHLKVSTVIHLLTNIYD